jgi:hypothetical protein
MTIKKPTLISAGSGIYEKNGSKKYREEAKSLIQREK